MGLFGGSSTTENTTVKNTEVNATNTFNPTGTSPGSTVLNISPTDTGDGTFGSISPSVFNAPLYITASTNTGDAAIQAAQQTAQDAATASTAGVTSSLPSWLQNLLSGNGIYWVIAALVLFMLGRGHGR